MAELLNPLVGVLGVSALATLGLGVYVWRHRHLQGALPLAALMFAAATWSAGSVLSLLAMTMQTNVLATIVAYLGISLVPVAWLFLALEYAGKDRFVTRRTVGAALVVPTITHGLAWTNDAHSLMWKVDGLTTVDSYIVLDLTAKGPWFYVHTAYSYALLAAGTVLLLQTIRRTKPIYRWQVTAMLAALAVPWATNVVQVLDLAPVGFDPTPFSFGLSGGLLTLAVIRFRLLDLRPIARDVVFGDMDDAVVVLDERDRVVDMNSAAASLLDVDDADSVGRPATAVFDDAYVDRFRDVIQGQARLTDDRGGQRRTIELRISPLHGPDQSRCGRTIILRDVTLQVEQRRELERKNRQLRRQNEQLEEFADVVSHDLRNPLAVATTHTELVTENDVGRLSRDDHEHLEQVARAHTRMKSLVEDLMTLAQEGRAVGETTAVQLQNVVETAGSTVEEVTVVFDTDLYEVQADPGRLQQALENLFRNVVDHAGTETTVRVGTLGDSQGFYVADDGPGIPPEDRERVFESGFTQSSGTGLGLAIVKNIVSAHGWRISTTSSRDGGARFEIRTDGQEATECEENLASAAED